MAKGVKRHGDMALHALMAEFGQIHKHKTFEPLDASKLPAEVKAKALALITMIKEQRCGKIKARACADGRSQRRYIKKSDVASPTMQLESLIMS